MKAGSAIIYHAEPGASSRISQMNGSIGEGLIEFSLNEIMTRSNVRVREGFIAWSDQWIGTVLQIARLNRKCFLNAREKRHTNENRPDYCHICDRKWWQSTNWPLLLDHEFGTGGISHPNSRHTRRYEYESNIDRNHNLQAKVKRFAVLSIQLIFLLMSTSAMGSRTAWAEMRVSSDSSPSIVHRRVWQQGLVSPMTCRTYQETDSWLLHSKRQEWTELSRPAPSPSRTTLSSDEFFEKSQRAAVSSRCSFVSKRWITSSKTERKSLTVSRENTLLFRGLLRGEKQQIHQNKRETKTSD